MREDNIIQLSPYVRTFKRPDDFIMFHSLIGGGCSVTSTIYNVLKSLNQRKKMSDLIEQFKEIPVSEILDIVDTFTKKKFIISEEENSSEYDKWVSLTNNFVNNLIDGGQISSIQLIVSNMCNFKCKYCFINSIYVSEERKYWQKANANKVMTAENAIRYIDNVINYIKSGKDKQHFLHIQFFGGEPLTNKPVIKSVLDHYKFGEEQGISLSYSIVTNGSLIDEDIAEYFSKYKVSVSVSFDNPDESVRNDKNGKNDVPLILNNLTLLQKHNVHTSFNSVLSSETFSYFDSKIVDCAIKYGVKEIGILFDLNPSFYENFDNNLIVNKLLSVFSYAKEKNVIVSGYWWMLYAAIFQNSSYLKGFKTCVGTGSQLSIEPSGAVFACKGSSAYFGNVQNLSELFKNSTYRKYAGRNFTNSEKCKGCALESFCSGYCLGPLEKKYNNVCTMEENYCHLTKSLIKKLMLQENSMEKYWL
jgi:uncharacterized protein